MSSELFGWLVVGLALAKTGAQFWLEKLNRGYVMAHRGRVPDALAGVMDAATYCKSVEYTLAKSRLQQVELLFNTVVLLGLLFSGVLPKTLNGLGLYLGTSAWAMAVFLLLTGFGAAFIGLPLDWYAQFRLEQQFGFNSTTQRTWWMDRVKGLLLAVLLGYPLLVVILKLVDWTAQFWWLWSWAVLVSFQLLMAVLAPVLILPLFNKFVSLQEGPLRDRLLRLADKTRFQARSIQVMDGSKRSRHSNAFFTGFGRFRKIVLFDTLLQQLADPELEAVLAHEIGHYKKKHVPKMLLASAVGSLLGFYFLSLLSRQDWFYSAFGFAPGAIGVALLLFAMLSGMMTFWLSPVIHWWVRRYEYQADAFAADVTERASFLISALRKLNEKNLSNLTPHPLYSRFYYSHPTLLERERALSGM